MSSTSAGRPQPLLPVRMRKVTNCGLRDDRACVLTQGSSLLVRAGVDLPAGVDARVAGKIQYADHG